MFPHRLTKTITLVVIVTLLCHISSRILKPDGVYTLITDMGNSDWHKHSDVNNSSVGTISKILNKALSCI